MPLNKLLNKNLMRDPSQKAVDELIAYIANNPTVDHNDLFRKSMEMGYNPQSLIDRALGSVKIDKSGASLSKPLEDIMNQVYEKNPTTGKRHIINPNDISSEEAKRIAGDFEKGQYGVAEFTPKGSRAVPSHQTILDAKGERYKQDAVAAGGHELKHNEDVTVRPGNVKQNAKQGDLGHHAIGKYEPDELIREVKDIPEDPRIAEQIRKHLPDEKVSQWKKLRGLLPIVGPALGIGGALMSGDASAAVGDALVPGGIEELNEPSINEIQQMQKQAHEQQKMNKLQQLLQGKK